jgi:hypothetical protein
MKKPRPKKRQTQHDKFVEAVDVGVADRARLGRELI